MARLSSFLSCFFFCLAMVLMTVAMLSVPATAFADDPPITTPPEDERGCLGIDCDSGCKSAAFCTGALKACDGPPPAGQMPKSCEACKCCDRFAPADPCPCIPFKCL
jgi:hypothetical protein